jgi:cobalt-precorrin-7 (C5)-methyltransferase
MITVVGMGPGHRKYLTQDAIDAIQQADVAIAFGRIVETAETLTSPVIRVARVNEVLEHMSSGKHIALLASGDPGFYGILEYLKKQNVVIERVIPGLSSFQYLMATLQKSWQHAHFISLHGREGGLEQVARHELSIILTDRQHTPYAISQQLHHMGIVGKLYVGYNLSYKNERIVEASIGDAIEECTDISIVVVEPI